MFIHYKAKFSTGRTSIHHVPTSHPPFMTTVTPYSLRAGPAPLVPLFFIRDHNIQCNIPLFPHSNYTP